MTLRCAGASWRVLVHKRFPRRHDGSLYGTSFHLTSDPQAPEKGARTAVALGLADAASYTVLEDTEFDELVIGKFLHVEQLGEGHWWLDAGGVSLDIWADRDGRPVKVFVREPEPVEGCEQVIAWERA